MQNISFFVAGVPKPSGSKRGFPIKRKSGKMGVAITDANPKAKEWKSIVALTARSKATSIAFKMIEEGSLALDMVFVMPRPKSHYRSNGQIKDNASDRPNKRPDLLKLARSVEDALTGILYKDDAQIVQENLEKVYVGYKGGLNLSGVYVCLRRPLTAYKTERFLDG